MSREFIGSEKASAGERGIVADSASICAFELNGAMDGLRSLLVQYPDLFATPSTRNVEGIRALAQSAIRPEAIAWQDMTSVDIAAPVRDEAPSNSNDKFMQDAEDTMLDSELEYAQATDLSPRLTKHAAVGWGAGAHANRDTAQQAAGPGHADYVQKISTGVYPTESLDTLYPTAAIPNDELSARRDQQTSDASRIAAARANMTDAYDQTHFQSEAA